MKYAYILLSIIITCSQAYGQAFDHFVTRSGHQLLDGEKEYRFISFNVPTINYIEDEMTFESTNPYALPTEFEMRDVFATVKEMGGQVIRIYTIPVKNKEYPQEAPTYVEGPGEFNEEAFKTTDMMLALANEYEIRIIFSLLNNWSAMGGVPNYADFRNKTEKEFWTDPQLIEDFKKTIEYTINRKNTITGTTYKNDKAILCWETGNELYSPYSWTKQIASYVKQLDKNHLLMDGFYASDSRPVMEEAILDDNIDIVSSHHYQRDPFQVAKDIDRNLKTIKGRKPYVIGEFGFSSTSNIEGILNTVIEDHEISGALIWSLRHHREKGGFYEHSEPGGHGLYKAYRWPGFNSGNSYDEASLMQMYRRKAFEIQQKEVPSITIPNAPKLLPTENVYHISWKGAMGASFYTLERSQAKKGPYKVIGFQLTDTESPYFPLYNDKTAKIGETYYYRLSAANAAGSSAYSEVLGPIAVKDKALIDNMKNFGTLFESKSVTPTSGKDRSFKEDPHRMAGDYGAEIFYAIPGDFLSLKIFSYEEKNWKQLKISGSANGEDWEPLPIKLASFANDESNYDYWTPQKYSLKKSDIDTPIRYIKIEFYGVAQVGRVEITYQ